VGKISSQMQPEMTPRTEYNHLPNHEFNKFLEDDDQILPVSQEQIKRDEELARRLQYE
jgi:ribosomal 50S subunit-associated protein YjgA (DUF615 family)